MPPGRVFGPDEREQFLELVATKGMHEATAAETLGFSPRTVRRHLQDDHEFREAFTEARDLATARVEDVVYDEAVRHRSAWAIKMWLTNRAERGRWVDERDRAGGSGGAGALASPALLIGAMREVLQDGSTRESAIGAIMSVPLPIETTARE